MGYHRTELQIKLSKERAQSTINAPQQEMNATLLNPQNTKFIDSSITSDIAPIRGKICDNKF